MVRIPKRMVITYQVSMRKCFRYDVTKLTPSIIKIHGQPDEINEMAEIIGLRHTVVSAVSDLS